MEEQEQQPSARGSAEEEKQAKCKKVAAFFTDILLSFPINSLLTPSGKLFVKVALCSSYFKFRRYTPTDFSEWENIDT